MVEVRTRSNSEIVDAAFELYRRHFSVFFTLAVVGFLPTVILSSLGPSPENPSVNPLFFLVLPVTFIFTSVGAGAIVIATSQAYVGSGPVDVSSALRPALKRPFALLWAYFLKMLYIGFGLLLLIVPGLLAFRNYFGVPSTVLLEDLSVSDGMKRSKALARGQSGRIFQVVGLTWLFYIIAVVLISGVVQFILHGSIWGDALMLVMYGAIYPLIEIVATLLYYDLRVRSEGYDIELMAKNLDAATAS